VFLELKGRIKTDSGEGGVKVSRERKQQKQTQEFSAPVLSKNFIFKEAPDLKTKEEIRWKWRSRLGNEERYSIQVRESHQTRDASVQNAERLPKEKKK